MSSSLLATVLILIKINTMTIEKQPNGSLLITDIVNSQWIKKVYYFTTLRDAKRDFKAYAKEIQKNWYEHLAR